MKNILAMAISTLALVTAHAMENDGVENDSVEVQTAANEMTSAPAMTTVVKEEFQLMNVAQLKTAMSTKTTAIYIYDANTDDIRKKNGMIPTAKVIDSYSKYDIAKTLPAEKSSKLVFYCGNTECTASHTAAKRAAKAGYKNVSVMTDGIEGWVKAGEKTEAFKKKI